MRVQQSAEGEGRTQRAGQQHQQSSTPDKEDLTSRFRNRANDTDARASKKSPARIASLFPNTKFTEFMPRRVSAMSITSSCSSDAVWIISLHRVRHQHTNTRRQGVTPPRRVATESLKERNKTRDVNADASHSRDFSQPALGRRDPTHSLLANFVDADVGRVGHQQHQCGPNLLPTVIFKEVSVHKHGDIGAPSRHGARSAVPVTPRHSARVRQKKCRNTPSVAPLAAARHTRRRTPRSAH